MSQQVKHYQVIPLKGQLIPEIFRSQLIRFNESFGWDASQSLSDFDNALSEYYVMCDEQCIIGYVGLHHVIDEVTINHVYIDVAYRRQGLGTALLNFVIEQLTYREVVHIFLEVRQNNQSAIALYKKSGFQTLITRKHYYSNPVDDALIMQLALNTTTNSRLTQRKEEIDDINIGN